MFRRLWRFAAPVVAIALLGLAPAVRADTIKLVGAGGSGGGPFSYTFQVTLDASGELVTGANVQTVFGGTAAFGPSLVTLYDFTGLTGAVYTPSVAAAAFAVSIQPLGITPLNPGVLGLPPLVVTDTGAPNVTLTYTGVSGLTTASLPTVAANGDRLLGTLTLTSPILFASGTFFAYAQQDNNLPGHIDDALVSSVAVVIPLPPAIWAGLSLMGLMGVRGYRRQRLIKAGE